MYPEGKEKKKKKKKKGRGGEPLRMIVFFPLKSSLSSIDSKSR